MYALNPAIISLDTQASRILSRTNKFSKNNTLTNKVDAKLTNRSPNDLVPVCSISNGSRRARDDEEHNNNNDNRARQFSTTTM